MGGDEHVGGEEKFDDTKRLIRSHISKNRQYSDK